MKRKSAAYAILVILVTLAVVWGVQSLRLMAAHRQLANTVKQDVERNARAIAHALAALSDDYAALHSYRDLQTRYTLIQGKVGSSHIVLMRQTDGRALVHTDPSLVAQTLKSEVDKRACRVSTVLVQDVERDGLFDVAVRLQSPGDPPLVVRVGMPYRKLLTDIR